MNATRPKVLLLDMDGVVLRHPTVTRILSNRVQSFVKRKINPYMTDEKAERINQVLYKEFGHTVLGLQKVYDSNIGLDEFCKDVYGKAFMDYLAIMDKDEAFMNNANEVRRVIQYFKEQEIPIYIFSNANFEWCRVILDKMGLADAVMNKRIIGCDHYIYTTAKNEVCLKPNYATYTKAVQHIYHTEGKGEEKRIIYVDDQLKNLIPVMHNKLWKPVWFNSKPDNRESLYTENITTVHKLPELFNFI